MVRARLAVAALSLAFGTAAGAAPPADAAPVIGDFAYDPLLHDRTIAGGVDPLPVERSEDLQWMIHDSRPHAPLATPAAGPAPATLAARLGQTAPVRLAHRLGADAVVVPLWTLHFGG